jgi:hypothetical protein
MFCRGLKGAVTQYCGQGKKVVCEQTEGWRVRGDFNGEWPHPGKPMFIRPSDYFVCMATCICYYYSGDFYNIRYIYSVVRTL